MGYLSGTAMWLRAQQSPQGLQSPCVFVGTMCSREDRLLADGQIMPSSNMCLNSRQAALSRSGESRLRLVDQKL